jgi:hypothetical protein
MCITLVRREYKLPSIEHRTVDGVDGKECTKCKVWKPLDKYGKHNKRLDGLHCLCRVCITSQVSVYRKNNRDKVNIWVKNYRYKGKREKTDAYIKNKIRDNLSRRMRHVLNGRTKNESISEIIGCSHEELKKHIESTFTERMTWENYGDWHIDHIIPCAAFDHTNEYERKACWNFKNLKALWGDENMKKGSNFIVHDKQEYLNSFHLKL